MKFLDLLKYLIPSIVAFICFYLLGAFFSASFNVAEWLIPTRGAVVVLSFMVLFWQGMTSQDLK